MQLWAVQALEETPPAGTEPIEWLLLTTCAVHTTAEALERVDWYACRWGVEVWHRILKSGCRIEARQLETAERLQRCLPLYSVIAWRIFYATMLSRAVPEAPCTALLALEEWQALLLRHPSHAHAAARAAVPAAGGALDCPARGLCGPPGRWRTRGDRVVERLSASDRPYNHVLYHAPSPRKAKKCG